MARKKRQRSAKMERCIQKVKAKGTGNPWAICQASVGKGKGKSKKKKK